MRIPSGVTDQYIYFVAVDATDFTTRETGLSSFTVYRSRNGAAAAAMTTPTINETDSSNMPGVYELLLDEDMTIAAGNDSEEMVFHITHAGMAPVTRTIELYRPKITAGQTLTVTSGVASANALQISGDSGAADSLEAALDGTGGVTITAAITGNITGNLSGSVGSVTGNVGGNVTGSVASVTGNVGGNVTGSVGSVTGGINTGSGTITTLDALDTAQDSQHSTTQSAISGLSIPSAGAIADAVLDEALSGHTTAGTLGKAISDTESDATAILADTNELQTNQGNWLTATGFSTHSAADVWSVATRVLTANTNLNDPTAAAIADQVWEEALADHSGTSGSTAEALNAAGSAGDPWTTTLPGSYTGSQAGKMLSDILTDTAEIGTAGAGLTEAGGTGDHLTAIPWNSSWDAEVQSECADAINAYDPPTNTEMAAAFTEIKGATWATTDTLEAIRDRGDAAWTTATGFSTHSAADVWSVATRVLTANTNLNDPTAAAIADAVLDEALSGHTTAGSLGKAVADIETDATAILADTDELQTNQGNWATATGFSTHSAADVRTEMDSNSTQLAAIVADTNELQTNQGNWLTATGFSTHSAADVWSVATRVLTANTNLNDPTVAAIADAVLDEALSGHTTAGTLGKAVADIETDVDAVLVDTGTTLPATLSGLNDVSVSDIWTTQLTESYAADGSAPTGTQALMLIQQALTEFAYSGTSFTVKKLDGSTTAAVMTLDDGTSPTSSTRSS